MGSGCKLPLFSSFLQVIRNIEKGAAKKNIVRKQVDLLFDCLFCDCYGLKSTVIIKNARTSFENLNKNDEEKEKKNKEEKAAERVEEGSIDEEYDEVEEEKYMRYNNAALTEDNSYQSC